MYIEQYLPNPKMQLNYYAKVWYDRDSITNRGYAQVHVAQSRKYNTLTISLRLRGKLRESL
jgi:hypothetical protein